MMQIKQAAGKGWNILKLMKRIKDPKLDFLQIPKWLVSVFDHDRWRGGDCSTVQGIIGSINSKNCRLCFPGSRKLFTPCLHRSPALQLSSSEGEGRGPQLVNIIIVILRWNWCTELNITSHKKKRSFILMLTKCFKEKQHLKCRWY